MSEEALPEEVPGELEGEEQPESTPPDPEVTDTSAEDDETTSDTPAPAPSHTSHIKSQKFAPIATSTPRSLKINVQHEAGQLKNIILEDDQLGQATIDFSDISRNLSSGTGQSLDLCNQDDPLQVSVVNLPTNGKALQCPVKSGANCDCADKDTPKFTRQLKKPPSDEETSMMVKSILGRNLFSCKKALDIPPPIRTSTPLTNQGLAMQYARPSTQAVPGPSHMFPGRSGPSDLPVPCPSRIQCPQNTPCSPSFGSSPSKPVGAQFSGSGIGCPDQSGFSPQHSRGPCPGGQMSPGSPQPLPHFGRGHLDSSVYPHSYDQTRQYEMPKYHESTNESSWLAPPPQRSQCPGQGTRMNRSMPLGPVSSGQQKCPPMSQSDGTLRQLETTNNRLMNLGRQVVDMRAELQPSGGCNEKLPCGENRYTVADALANNQNIVCDLEKKITQLQNEMKAMLCSVTQSNQFPSVSTSQPQKSSAPKKTCCMKCKCKKPHTGSPCKT